jgi:hypothetical protein
MRWRRCCPLPAAAANSDESEAVSLARPSGQRCHGAATFASRLGPRNPRPPRDQAWCENPELFLVLCFWRLGTWKPLSAKWPMPNYHQWPWSMKENCLCISLLYDTTGDYIHTKIPRLRCVTIFKNIFAEKIGEKWSILTQNTVILWEIWAITFVFNRFAKCLQKIGQNRQKFWSQRWPRMFTDH